MDRPKLDELKKVTGNTPIEITLQNDSESITVANGIVQTRSAGGAGLKHEIVKDDDVVATASLIRIRNTQTNSQIELPIAGT